MASVNATTGEITPLSPGATTIGYVSSNSMSNSTTVTVYAAAAVKNPMYWQVLQLDEITTAVVGAGLSAIDTDKSFSSTTPGISNIHATTGQVTAVGDGTSVITYATISDLNPSGHVFLDVTKVGTGADFITFDYTDSDNVTGTVTWLFNFQ